MLQKKCPVCQKNFIKAPKYSYLQWEKRIFCSKSCKGKAMKPVNLIHNKPHSKETKKRLSEFFKGKSSPMKGRHLSQGTKEKIRKAFLGKKSSLWKDGRSSKPGYESFRCFRRYVRKKGNGGSHTLEEWKELKKKYNYRCAICEKKEPEIKLTEDHILSLKLGGNDNIDNIQPLCGSCNSKKGWKSKLN